MRQNGARNNLLIEVTVRGQSLEPLHHGDQTVGGVVSDRKILKLNMKKNTKSKPHVTTLAASTYLFQESSQQRQSI